MISFMQYLKENHDLDLQLRKLGLKRTNKFNGIGKEMVNTVYCHKQYENQFPTDELITAKSKLPKDFQYNVVKYDYKTGTFSFIMSSNFDSNPEPDLDYGITVKQDGSAKPFNGNGWIYHNKFLFVADNYQGFDVDKSKRRSIQWSSLTGIDKSRIGQRKYWDVNVIPLIGDKFSMKPLKQLLAEIIHGASSDTVSDIRDREGIKFSTDNGHPTQRSNTVATYKKFYEMLPEELRAGTGLDFSAGLGMGSDMLRSVYKADIDSYEPFPHRNSKDITFAGMGSLPDKQYDYVICSAVLNVVERDIRDQIVKEIWDHLKEGGQAIIGVRSRADVMGTKTALVINAEQGEVLDRSRGSYQKGFTGPELKEYIESILPSAVVQRVSISGLTQVTVRVWKDINYDYSAMPVVDGGVTEKEPLFRKALRGEDY